MPILELVLNLSHFGILVLESIWHVPQKKVTKADINWDLYRIRIFVFLTLLQIFVPRLEILFCINHYFLLYIFKYRTSLGVNSVLEI